MKAAIQVGVGRYEIRDVPVPEITPGQCLVKVAACTICATDVKYLQGAVELDWPSPMGHEVTGTVERVGSAVTGFKLGDRVLSRMAWGGFAECVPADADLLAPLPETVGFEEGAIAQLLPIAVRGAELGMGPGKTVFVSGLGGAGLMCVQAARAYGASTLIAADLHANRRAVAQEVGADLCIDPKADDVVERVLAETDGGVDLAMEAAGAEASFRACEAVLGTGGILSVFGSHLEPIALDLRRWERGCLQLHMMVEPADEKSEMLRKAVALVAAGKIRLKPLLSKVMKLDDIVSAFDLVVHRPDEYIKIAIVP